MAHAHLALVAAVAAAPAFAQSITREYHLEFAEAESDAGPSAAFASSRSFDYPLPAVLEGPEVRVVGVGFTLTGTRRLEADYVNTGPAPVTLSTGITRHDSYAIVGDPNGCAFGVDPAGGNLSGGGAVTVPANSTRTLVQLDDTVHITASSGPGSFSWPCVLAYDELQAAIWAEIDSPAAQEVRADVTLVARTRVTAELLANPTVTSSCPPPPNSLGLSGEIEYFGSSDAGTAHAAIRLRRAPVGVPAACFVTDAFGATPIGAGPAPDLCLRGGRRILGLAFTEAAGPWGEATFDLTLAPFAPGETFAIQVAHRDLFTGVGTTNMLVGTAR